MSQPATDPTPAAPATPPAAPAPTPAPAPPANPTPPAPAAAPAFDPSTLPADAQAYLKQQISDADHKARTNARAAAAAQARQDLAAQLAPVLGLGQQLTPEQLLEQAQDQAFRANVELALHRVAGVDHAKTLVDSVAFLNAVDEIEAEVGTPEFDAALEAKIKEQMAARGLTPGQPAAPPAGQGPAPTPGQGPGPRPDPSQGARGTPAARPTSLGQALAAHYGKR